MSKEYLIKTRNKINKTLYKEVIRPIFFQIDPEVIHDKMIFVGTILGSNFITRNITSFFFTYSNKKLRQKIVGITFKNPIGLAAGFDKNAQLTKILPSVGLGFAEVGSITGEACKGNAKPRLWRLKKSKGLLVYYGLKNKGCRKIAKRIRNQKFNIPIGISIAKTNCKQTIKKEAGIKDYIKAFSTLKWCGDYMTINISCPNAYGGQPFTKPEDLNDLLIEIKKIPCEKPIFLKLSPDLTIKEIDNIINICNKHSIQGFICSNLVKKRANKDVERFIRDKNLKNIGGISGKPTKEISTKLIAHIYKKTKGKYVIIGCGGVFSANDAYAKIKAGASLIQLITGMIYEGPQVISEINQGLVKLLKKDGYTNISQAIGKEVEI
jgi:dihydroorotate dehydrogenase